MSYAAHRDRPSWQSRVTLLLLVFALLSATITLRQVGASPLTDLAQEYQNLVSENSTDLSTDSSADNYSTANTDVYIIKVAVYEIGVLTDTDNTTSGESTERHEKIDISLYDPQNREHEFS